jgi:2-polyprenyl-6-methoxyphenol hydroxylase-like FAD-dependent oxidoreductase
VPDHLLTRLTSVLPLKNNYMIVTQSIYKPGAELIEDAIGDHLIWVFVSPRTTYGNADPKSMEGSSIKSLVLDNMTTWHPVLRQLVSDSDPTEVAAVTVLSSIPSAWQPSNVTLVGDAIHTMTPLQGLGGSTALRDAGLLCRKLIEADRGRSTLLNAIRDYECAMRDYSFRAVRRSAQFGRLVLSDNWLLRTSFRTALRVVTRTPALKRKIFHGGNWS